MFPESTLLHSVWWSLDLSLSLKMAYILISTLDSKFILDLYHIIHSSVQVNYLYFHQFDVLNGATRPGLGYVVFEICSFLKYSRRGPDLSYCLCLFIYIYIFFLISFSLMGVHFSSHAHSGSYEVHPISAIKRPLYQCYSTTDARSSFWQWPFPMLRQRW